MSWEKKNTTGVKSKIHIPGTEVLFTRPNDERIWHGWFIEFMDNSGLYRIKIAGMAETYVAPERMIGCGI